MKRQRLGWCAGLRSAAQISAAAGGGKPRPPPLSKTNRRRQGDISLPVETEVADLE
jgi:hypothetical protein